MASEVAALEAGGARVKFSAVWKGTIEDLLQKDKDLEMQCRAAEKSMADIALELEETGVAPVMPDGKVGGNISCVLHDSHASEHVLVTKSGKVAHHRLTREDVAIVTLFDTDNWEAE